MYTPQDYHLTCTVLLHYLVKFKNTEMLANFIEAPLHIDAVHLFVRVPPKCMHKNSIFSKTKHF